MMSGGLIVSVVGGDGAGKTTAINEIYIWLAENFDILKVHMGKPRWSLLTIALRGLLKIGCSLGLYPFMRAPIQYSNSSMSYKFPGYPWMLREVCTARDRYRTYVKAQRLAINGSLVICDRFPLIHIKLMDGPQVERMTSNIKRNKLIRLLIEIEKRYYRSITPPSLLIVLKTNPDIAVMRKTDENEDSVRARSKEIWDFDWEQLSAHVIDANRSKEEVISELKSLVWSKL